MDTSHNNNNMSNHASASYHSVNSTEVLQTEYELLSGQLSMLSSRLDSDAAILQLVRAKDTSPHEAPILLDKDVLN
jgi:hypothetical protein